MKHTESNGLRQVNDFLGGIGTHGLLQAGYLGLAGERA